MMLQKLGWGWLLISALVAPVWAQTATTQSAPQSAPIAPAQPGDELAQMRDDLNKLESLNLNMSSEIEFLRDQNLQILLRTNSQMWGLLIRDLRRRVEREEQRRNEPPPAAGRGSNPKPDR